MKSSISFSWEKTKSSDLWLFSDVVFSETIWTFRKSRFIMAGRTVLQAAEAIERFPLLLYKRILRFVLFFFSVFLENLLFSLKNSFFLKKKQRFVFFPPKIVENSGFTTHFRKRPVWWATLMSATNFEGTRMSSPHKRWSFSRSGRYLTIPFCVYFFFFFLEIHSNPFLSCSNSTKNFRATVTLCLNNSQSRALWIRLLLDR